MRAAMRENDCILIDAKGHGPHFTRTSFYRTPCNDCRSFLVRYLYNPVYFDLASLLLQYFEIEGFTLHCQLLLVVILNCTLPIFYKAHFMLRCMLKQGIVVITRNQCAQGVWYSIKTIGHQYMPFVM